MKQIAVIALFVLLVGAMRPVMAAEQLVLIVGAQAKITELDSPVVRKLFLGLPVNREGLRLRPAINQGDSKIRELFLQNIVSMSDSSYDRFLLHSMLQGRSQPHVYTDAKLLVDAVAADPTLVSFAWGKDVARDPRIRILRVLWHD